MKEFTKGFSLEACRQPELVVVGCSAGGIDALKGILSSLPQNFKPAMVIVQHVSADTSQCLADFFKQVSNAKIKEAEDKEPIEFGSVYFAPAGYHLMISKNRNFELSVEEPVNFSRPAIDILFETAADAYQEKLLGLVLTGANEDGALGLERIQARGGQVFIQEPRTAEFSSMPEGALKRVPRPDGVLELKEIQNLLEGFTLEWYK